MFYIAGYYHLYQNMAISGKMAILYLLVQVMFFKFA